MVSLVTQIACNARQICCLSLTPKMQLWKKEGGHVCRKSFTLATFVGHLFTE
jgi:hypothetical protein